ERQPSNGQETPEEELLIPWVKEVGRSIDYLETRKEIDAQHIAYYGFSMGTDIAPIVGAVEPRIKSLILMGGGYWPNPPQVNALNFAPRTRIPLLMIQGADDFGIGKRGPQLFGLFGTPSNQQRFATVEGGHIPSKREPV